MSSPTDNTVYAAIPNAERPPTERLIEELEYTNLLVVHLQAMGQYAIGIGTNNARAAREAAALIGQFQFLCGQLADLV